MPLFRAAPNTAGSTPPEMRNCLSCVRGPHAVSGQGAEERWWKARRSVISMGTSSPERYAAQRRERFGLLARFERLL